MTALVTLPLKIMGVLTYTPEQQAKPSATPLSWDVGACHY
jgi:hypothetical protein